MTRIILHGAGTEARAAAEHFLSRPDTDVALYDDQGSTLPGIKSLSKDAVEAALPSSLYLRSPGVPPSNAMVQLANQRADQVTTPTGYWLENFAPAGTITVTGTKGKSTTTALLASLLQHAGLTSCVLGNIGSPPLGRDLPQAAYPVVELSSYMMYDLPHTNHCHVVTSLFKEHTDWHGSEAAYRAAKLRPFRSETPAPGFAPRSVIHQEALPPTVTAVDDVVSERNGSLIIGGHTIDGPENDQGFSRGPLKLALAMAAAVATRHLAPADVAKAAGAAAKAFRGLPSRQYLLPTDDERLWVDDALATIPEATLAALERFEGRDIGLILGGSDRGQSFSSLEAWLKNHPRVRAFIFGPVADRFCASVAERCPNFEDAINKAADAAGPKGVVLFSPAAPSSPPHASFQERAKIFADIASQSR